MRELELNTRMSEAEARSLNAGDLVFLTGEVYEVRTAAQYTKLMAQAERGEPLPFKTGGATIFHSLASYRSVDSGLRLNYIGFVSSFITNKLMPGFLRRHGSRAIVGKGGMSGEVHEAMKDMGCVYLSSISGCTALYSSRIMGMDQLSPEWGLDKINVYELKDFGPLVVGMDAKGSSIYAEPARAKAAALEALKK